MDTYYLHYYLHKKSFFPHKLEWYETQTKSYYLVRQLYIVDAEKKK